MFFFKNQFEVWFLPYLLILAILTYVSVKEKNIKNVLIALVSLSVGVCFILMDKVNIRTNVLNYSIAIIIMIFNLDQIKILNAINLNSFFISISIVIIVSLCIETFDLYRNISFNKSYNEFVEYVYDQDENIYFYSGYALNNRHYKNNILSTNEKKAVNISPIASWLVHSEDYIKFLKNNNINEVYKAIVEREDVFVVTGNYYNLKESTQLNAIITYIKEHYSISDIKIKNVQNFNDDIFIYKLSI